MPSPSYTLTPSILPKAAVSNLLPFYRDARDAFDRGNYELALDWAAGNDDARVGALAKTMFGALHAGSGELAPLLSENDSDNIYLAFAHWLQNRPADGSACLASVETTEGSDAHQLRVLMDTPSVKIVVFHDDNNREALPTRNLPGIEVCAFREGRYEKGARLKDMLSEGWDNPDLILTSNVFGDWLPDDIFDFAAPVVFCSNDFDQSMDLQLPDLKRSDLVVVENAYEACMIEKICRTRTVTYGFGHRDIPPDVQPIAKEKSLDIGFSGTAFARHWRERARYLFRIASIDDPDLRIRIHHGYLAEGDYLALMDSAKFIPQSNRYPFSIRQFRTLDCMTFGHMGLVYDGITPEHFIEGTKQQFHLVSDEKLESDIVALVDRFDEIAPEFDNVRQSIHDALTDYIPPMTERQSRLIRFCLAQCYVLAGAKTPNPDSISAAEIDAGAAMAFKDFLANPTDDTVWNSVQSELLDETQSRPDALIPLFNLGLFYWISGDKEQACRYFESVMTKADDGLFDPSLERLPSHRVRAFSDLHPYQEYYQAILDALSAEDAYFTGARMILAATAMTFQALYVLQKDQHEMGLSLLEAALRCYPDHHGALKLAAKAAAAADRDAEEVLIYFYRAVKTYPPVITELLSLGLWAHEKRGEHVEAAALARRWSYFITRVTWSNEDDHVVPEETVSAVGRYVAGFPASLREDVQARFPGRVSGEY